MRLFFLTMISGLLVAFGAQTVPMGPVFPISAAPSNPYVRGNSAARGCSTCTLAFSSNNAGDALVVAVTSDIPSAITSVADSVNGSYTLAGSFDAGNYGNTLNFYVFCGTAASSGSNTITISASDANYKFYAIAEYSGTPSSSCVDGTGAATGGCCTALASGTYTVGANDVWIGWGYCGGGAAATAGSGFAIESAPSSTGFYYEDGVFSGTTAQATMTCPSGQWMIGSIALKQ